MHSAVPRLALRPWWEVPSAISPTPAKEIAQPASSRRVSRSRSVTAASSAMNTGAMLTSRAAVPEASSLAPCVESGAESRGASTTIAPWALPLETAQTSFRETGRPAIVDGNASM